MKSYLVSLLHVGSIDLAIKYFVSCLEKPEHKDELDSSFEEIIKSLVSIADEFSALEIDFLNMLPEPWCTRLGNAFREAFAQKGWLNDLNEIAAYQKRKITPGERDQIIKSVLDNYPQYGGFLESFIDMNRLVRNRAVRQSNLYLMLKHSLCVGNIDDITMIVREIKKLRPAATTVAVLDIVIEYFGLKKKDR